MATHETRTFAIPGVLQLVIALSLSETARALEEQKATRVPIRIHGASVDLPFVSEAESDAQIETCRKFVREIWDRAAIDLLIDGSL